MNRFTTEYIFSTEERAQEACSEINAYGRLRNGLFSTVALRDKCRVYLREEYIFRTMDRLTRRGLRDNSSSSGRIDQKNN
jgi:hypothetical protein